MKSIPLLKILMAAIFVCGLLGCRTSKPKGESLSAAEVPGSVSDLDQDSLTSQPIVNSADMWSPSQRRANASFHYLIALKSVLSGDFKTAAPYMESAYNLDPSAYTGSQLVELKLVNGEAEEARQESHRMTLLYPKDAKLRLQYGQVLLSQKDLDGSMSEFKKAIQLDSRLEDAYLLLGKVNLLRKQPSIAIDTAKQLVKVVPGSAKGWSFLTRLLVVNRRYSEALVPASKMWALQQNQPEAALLYALVLDLNGKSKDAVSLYEQIYRINPSSPELVQRMIALYQELGDLNQSLSIVEDMISRTRQNHPGLIMQKALLLSELGRNDEALKCLDDFLEEKIESDRIQYMSGIILEKLNRPEEAYQRYTSIQEDSAVKMPSNFRRAIILKDQKKGDEAVALLIQQTKRTEADAMAWQILIEVQSDLKRFEDALKSAQDAVKAFPSSVSLLFVRGVYEERTGRLADAEGTMRLVIQKDPKHASGLNFLGYMLAEQGRELDQAEVFVKRALAIRPNDGSFMDSLGWIQFKRADYSNALITLKKAAEASPKEPVIFEHIADVYLKLNDLQNAYQNLDQALSMEVDDRDRPRIQEKFEQVKIRLKSE